MKLKTRALLRATKRYAYANPPNTPMGRFRREELTRRLIKDRQTKHKRRALLKIIRAGKRKPTYFIPSA
jgi:hypothetical protein